MSVGSSWSLQEESESINPRSNIRLLRGWTNRAGELRRLSALDRNPPGPTHTTTSAFDLEYHKMLTTPTSVTSCIPHPLEFTRQL